MLQNYITMIIFLVYYIILSLYSALNLSTFLFTLNFNTDVQKTYTQRDLKCSAYNDHVLADQDICYLICKICVSKKQPTKQMICAWKLIKLCQGQLSGKHSLTTPTSEMITQNFEKGQITKQQASPSMHALIHLFACQEMVST